MENISEILRRPAIATVSSAKRSAALLGGETLAFDAVTIGDLIYDHARINPFVVEAFGSLHRASEGDIYALATCAKHIVRSGQNASYEGSVNQLQGYVFEQIAAHALRQQGAEVVFPRTPNNPAFDFWVNGEPVQAKCSLSPDLVTEHLSRYPNVPRVTVNEDLASHFINNDHVTAIHGATQASVRSITEHSLNHSADLLDLHLGEIVPIISVAKNFFHLWRGDTDLSALLGNLAADAAGRTAGAYAGKLAGFGTVAIFGLGGWPAILLPVLTATAGYRGGREVSNLIKQRLLMRAETGNLSKALQWWCLGAARVLDTMIRSGDETRLRFAALRNHAHEDYQSMIDDWLRRIEQEQEFRRYHLGRFERCAGGADVFDQGAGLPAACLGAMVAASRTGILPPDLSRERTLLASSLTAYNIGLRSRLLRH